MLGNIFLHGIFFAHGNEPYFLDSNGVFVALMTGDEDEQFVNPEYEIDPKTGYAKEKNEGDIKWKRNPQK